MAAVDGGLAIPRSNKIDDEETADLDPETCAYLQQAKREQHQILYLNYKHLLHIPRALVAKGDFTCVKQLYLRNNCLDKLPEGISNLVNLQILYLHSNKLTHLPKDISRCTELQNLDVSINELQEVPPCICHLPKLHILKMSDNRIKTISKDIRHLKQLRALYLRSNLITQVPREIAECESLKMIVLDCNKVSTLPRELTSLNPTSLQLFMHTNNLIYLPFGLVEVVKDLFIDRNPNLHGLAISDISSCRSMNQVVHSSFYNQCIDDIMPHKEVWSTFSQVIVGCGDKKRKIYLPPQVEHYLTEDKLVIPPLLELALRKLHRSPFVNKLSDEDVPESLRKLYPVSKCGMCQGDLLRALVLSPRNKVDLGTCIWCLMSKDTL